MKYLYKKVCCLRCRIEISLSNINKHINSKSCIQNNSNSYKVENLKGICPFCKLEISHLINVQRANHVRWCKENPNRQKSINRLNYARSLITNDSITKMSEKIKYLHSIGCYYDAHKKTGLKNKGRKISEETRLRQRISNSNSKHQRVCKSTHTFIDKNKREFKFDSKWEDYVAMSLDNKNIIWDRPKPIKYLLDGTMKNYFPDFYLPEFNLYLDPKNKYVISKQIEKLKILQTQINLIIIDNELDCKQFDLERFYDKISNYILVPPAGIEPETSS